MAPQHCHPVLHVMLVAMQLLDRARVRFAQLVIGVVRLQAYAQLVILDTINHSKDLLVVNSVQQVQYQHHLHKLYVRTVPLDRIRVVVVSPLAQLVSKELSALLVHLFVNCVQADRTATSQVRLVVSHVLLEQQVPVMEHLCVQNAWLEHIVMQELQAVVIAV